jgi:hypothetical protein
MLLSVRANVTISHCVIKHRLNKVTFRGTVCLQVLFLSSEHLRLSLKIMTIKWRIIAIIIIHYHVTFFLNLVCFWILFVILFFPSRRFVVSLDFPFVILNLECASVVRNSIRFTGSKKFYGILRKLVALCYNRLFSPDKNDCGYANALQLLNLHTVRERRDKVDAIAVINIFHGL